MFELSVFLLVASGMLASCAWALYTIQQSAENASLSARDIRAGGAVVGGSLLALLILVFSRRLV